MKRNSTETPLSDEQISVMSTKNKLETNVPGFEHIFSIARVDKNSTTGTLTENKLGDLTPDTCGIPCEKVRVGVSSKVNFSKLTPREQRLRFLNQADEIRRLRKKLRKYSGNKGRKEDSVLQKAIDKLRVAKFEIEDQKQLVENLIKAINSGKLVPNTLAYNQICTILRDLLALPCPESHHAIRLPEKTIPVSKLEYEEYMKLPCTPAVLRALVGRGQVGVEDPSELLRALHIQIFSSLSQTKMNQTTDHIVQ